MKKIKNYIIVILIVFVGINLITNFSNLYAEDNNDDGETGEIFYQVSLVGQVESPGTYNVNPGTRLTRIYNKVRRNVVLQRSGEEFHLDLLKFFRLGDVNNNPYLQDGDVVIVHPIRSTVNIIGAVFMPGSYELLEGDRITDIIELSLGVLPQAHLKRAEILRFVNRRDSTQKIEINLEKILNNPASEENLVLKADDRIYIKVIPEYHKKREVKVNVYGAVKEGGAFDLSGGYQIYDAIALAGGLKDNAYLPEAELVRFINIYDSTKSIEFNLEKIINDPDCDENLFLRNDDRLYIRSIPQFHKKDEVAINGEVKYPGSYAIKEDETRLLDIIDEAGGPTEFADLDNTYLQRRRGEEVLDPEFERLKKIPVEEMTDMEYEYFKTKSREMRGKFAIDFEHLMADTSTDYNVLLKNRDYIYFPDKSKTVYVSGSVKNPGLVTYVEGRNYKYYLEEAGGFAWRARKGKIRVIKANTREWLEPDEETKIEIGDMIFVPEKPEYDYWQIAQDVLAALGEVATVLIVIQNIK